MDWIEFFFGGFWGVKSLIRQEECGCRLVMSNRVGGARGFLGRVPGSGNGKLWRDDDKTWMWKIEFFTDPIMVDHHGKTTICGYVYSFFAFSKHLMHIYIRWWRSCKLCQIYWWSFTYWFLYWKKSLKMITLEYWVNGRNSKLRRI